METRMHTWTGLLLIIYGAESGILCAHQPAATLKGEDVTLSDGTEQPAGDVVYWFLDEELLAVKWYNTVEYHVNKTDKLHLDPQTGSLTIKEVSACDSGGYARMDYTFILQGDHQLNITSVRSHAPVPSANAVNPGRQVPVDKGVGETVTLYTNLSEVPECSIVIWDVITQSNHHIAKSRCLLKSSDIRYSGDANLRLSLNRANGSLTITNLKMTDSRLYSFKVLNNTRTTAFQLRVFGPLFKPAIVRIRASSSFLVQCSVKNDVEVSLSWYRGNQRISSTSSLNLKVELTLPLNVTAKDNSTYFCVAANPVGNQTSQLDKGKLRSDSIDWSRLALALLGLFVFALIRACCCPKYSRYEIL